MSWPCIIYNPGSGNVTLQFALPPTKVPAYDYQAVRHDNISSAGVREAILERIDTFFEFTMEWVGFGLGMPAAFGDIQAWNNFMLYALQGGQFQYYPDSAQSAYTNYWLEDTNWNAAYKAPGQYTFKMRWRKVVTGS